MPDSEDWTECRWSLPSGEPLPCDGTTTPLAAQPRGPEWVCNFRLDYPNGEHFSILRSALTQEHALEFKAAAVPLSGTVAFQGDGFEKTYNWTQVEGMILPLWEELPLTGEMHFLLYSSWLDTADPQLWNASLRQAVTWEDDEPFAIHHVKAADHYIFYDRVQDAIGEKSFTTIEIVSQDHNSTIVVDPALGGTFDFAILGAPGPNCANDSPMGGGKRLEPDAARNF